MHPHASLRRLIVLLTIAVAACAPGGSPGVSSSPGPSIAAATPAATLLATVAPSAAAVVLPTCTDPYALPSTAQVQFMTLRATPTASLQHVVATSTGSLGFVTPITSVDFSEVADIGRASGNRDLSFSVQPDSGGIAVVTAARASLRIGASSAVDLATAVTGYTPRMTMPDVQGNATIAMTLGWTDGCFTYTGDVAVSLVVELGATVAACPSTETAVRGIAESAQQVEFQIGTLQRLLAGESWSSKFLDLDGGEGVAQFSGMDIRQVPVQAAAGSPIEVSEPSTLLRMTGIDAAFFRFIDVQPDTYPDPVFNSTGVVHPDGSVGVPTPKVPGKYVLQIAVSWDSPCLVGSGQEWLVVKIT